MDALFTILSDLLDRHNCVVVPGLGGFVAEYRPAKLMAVQEQMLPPGKQLAFNPRLIRQDGLLPAALAEKEGITYDSAEQQVSRFAEQCKSKLTETRNLRLPGLGKLLLEDKDLIRFVPDETVNHLEDAFGLPELSIALDSSQQTTAAAPVWVNENVDTAKKPELAMDRWSPRAWGWAAAAVLVLVGAWQIMVVTESLPAGLAGLFPGQSISSIQDGRAAVLHPLIPSLPRQMATYGATTALSERSPSALLSADSSVQVLQPQDEAAAFSPAKNADGSTLPIVSKSSRTESSVPEPVTTDASSKLEDTLAPAEATSNAGSISKAGKTRENHAWSSKANTVRFAYGSGERPSSGFYLVVGSYPSESSAIKRLEMAGKEHGTPAILRASNGNYRAAFYVHTDEMVVWQRLDALRNAHQQPDAWILGYTARQ